MPADRITHLTAIRDARREMLTIHEGWLRDAQALAQEGAGAVVGVQSARVGVLEAVIDLAEAEIALLDAQTQP